MYVLRKTTVNGKLSQYLPWLDPTGLYSGALILRGDLPPEGEGECLP